MRCHHALKIGAALKQICLPAIVCLLFAGSAQAQIRITEVAPWSSGNSPIAHDWFELTNFGAASVNIGGWKMDDSSNSFAASVPLAGITDIGAGESVIFIESGDEAAFKTLWFGAPNSPASLQVGTYTGMGVGLSTGGDNVDIFNSGGMLQASVSFRSSPSGPSFPTFDNAAGLNSTDPVNSPVLISLLSVDGVNGAFIAAGDINEIGSPGAIPEPGSALLFVLGAGTLAGSAVRRRSQVKS